MGAPVERILIVGAGLAGRMTAAALSHNLPPTIRLTLVDCRGASQSDLFYGSVAAPSAYDFNLMAGLSEPGLILQSDTAFCLGTRYLRWGTGDRSWTQCFHQPLPAIDGVLLHQYLAQQRIAEFEPYLVAAVAAQKGVFAHPPGPGQHPFSRAEYGYQFDPHAYAGLFSGACAPGRVQEIVADIGAIECDETGIAGLRLSNGETCTADLYIDSTGVAASLLSRLGAAFSGRRRLRAVASGAAAERLGPPLRTVTSHAFGWQAETPLKARVMRLTVFDPASEGDALAAHGATPERAAEVTLGRRDEPWRGNCVGLGQAAGVVEPLTPAPLMLLQRDIERLLTLIPVSREMSVERREFNRQCGEDYRNADLFSRALFETEPLPDAPYWRAAREEPVDDRLARKLEQFNSRGLHVAFDFEPFNQEDWIILHYGMGRLPQRHDRMADRAAPANVSQYLTNLRNGIEDAVRTLPSHETYMANLTRYLLEKGA